MYLAWRLSCDEETLPDAANTPSTLFNFLLPGDKDLRQKAQSFSEARNAIAHRFHEHTYETKLNAFFRKLTGKDLPAETDEQLVELSSAVLLLSIELGCAMGRVHLRPPTPPPTLPLDISTAGR